MKFRKKPVVIEAMQFTKETKNQVFNWITCNHYASWDALDNPAIVIMTLEGEMRALVGDWIIKGVKGEFYPIRADIFAETYSPADEQEQAIPGLPEGFRLRCLMKRAIPAHDYDHPDEVIYEAELEAIAPQGETK